MAAEKKRKAEEVSEKANGGTLKAAAELKEATEQQGNAS